LESIFKKYKKVLKEFDQQLSILRLNNEWIYIGFCKNEAPEGLGILKNKNGMQIAGLFQVIINQKTFFKRKIIIFSRMVYPI
jgi:hypothetical protein